MAKKVLPWVIAIVVLALIPVVVRDPYFLHVLIMICVYTCLVTGLRLIMSTGQVSFAHAAIWGLGGYACVLLVMKSGLSFWIALPLGGLIAALVALPIGLICLRLKGPYFFIITLSFGFLITLVEKSWVGLTRGASGIIGVPPPNPISIFGLTTIEFTSKIPFVYLVMVLMLICLFVMYRLEGSRFGMACSAIRESDDLAETVGINPLKYKTLAFVTACFFAGLVGGFYAHYTAYIDPGFFSIHHMIYILLYAMVGGTASATGAIIGTAIMMVLSEVLRAFLPMDVYEPMIWSLVLILVLLFLPGGILSLVKRIPERIRGSRLNREEAVSGATHD